MSRDQKSLGGGKSKSLGREVNVWSVTKSAYSCGAKGMCFDMPEKRFSTKSDYHCFFPQIKKKKNQTQTFILKAVFHPRFKVQLSLENLCNN